MFVYIARHWIIPFHVLIAVQNFRGGTHTCMHQMFMHLQSMYKPHSQLEGDHTRLLTPTPHYKSDKGSRIIQEDGIVSIQPARWDIYRYTAGYLLERCPPTRSTPTKSTHMRLTHTKSTPTWSTPTRSTSHEHAWTARNLLPNGACIIQKAGVKCPL